MLTDVLQAIALVPNQVWLFLLGLSVGAGAVAFLNRKVTARRIADGIELVHEHIGDLVIGVGVLGILAKSMVGLAGSTWVQAIPSLAWAILSAGVAMGANRAGLAYFEQTRQKPSALKSEPQEDT